MTTPFPQSRPRRLIEYTINAFTSLGRALQVHASPNFFSNPRPIFLGLFEGPDDFVNVEHLSLLEESIKECGILLKLLLVDL